MHNDDDDDDDEDEDEDDDDDDDVVADDDDDESEITLATKKMIFTASIRSPGTGDREAENQRPLCGFSIQDIPQNPQSHC